MTNAAGKFAPIEFDRDIITIVGGLGSGKSEIAVNLARQFAVSDERNWPN